MEKNELLKSRKLKTERIIKKTISDFSKLPKKLKRRESNRVNRPADQNFRGGKNELSFWANFWNELSCQTRFAEWKKWKKTEKNKKKIFSLFFSFFHSESSFFLVPQKSSFGNFAHIKNSFFHSGKMFEAKICFLFTSLFQNFKFKYPIPNPP